MRPYVVGDDVRLLIDWNATARTGEPRARQVAERTLTTWLVLDVSPSTLTFGTAERRKADVAEEGVARAIGYAATRHGNRLGIVTFGGSRPRALPRSRAARASRHS